MKSTNILWKCFSITLEIASGKLIFSDFLQLISLHILINTSNKTPLSSIWTCKKPWYTIKFNASSIKSAVPFQLSQKRQVFSWRIKLRLHISILYASNYELNWSCLLSQIPLSKVNSTSSFKILGCWKLHMYYPY